MSKEVKRVETEDIQEKVFESINKNDIHSLEQLIKTVGENSVDFTDCSGKTPLQHACCKGNIKAVELLLNMGADVNLNKQGNNYTALHFAAISGNPEICRRLLDAGALSNVLNNVDRTPSQMAAFVGSHECVETINNYVRFVDIEEYDKPFRQDTETFIPKDLLNNFHTFIMDRNIHPIRIALNLKELGLIDYIVPCENALESLRNKEMQKQENRNEALLLKYHYLHNLLKLMRTFEGLANESKEKTSNDKSKQKYSVTENFIKYVLTKPSFYVNDICYIAIGDFPAKESNIYQDIIEISEKEALSNLKQIINGRKSFKEENNFCNTCGNEKPSKKCSMCKAVKYCDRECQRLHWFVHKKTCSQASSNVPQASSLIKQNESPIDVNEIREQISKMNGHFRQL